MAMCRARDWPCETGNRVDIFQGRLRRQRRTGAGRVVTRQYDLASHRRMTRGRAMHPHAARPRQIERVYRATRNIVAPSSSRYGQLMLSMSFHSFGSKRWSVVNYLFCVSDLTSRSNTSKVRGQIRLVAACACSRTCSPAQCKPTRRI